MTEGKKTFSLQLPAASYDALRRLAEADDRTVAAMARLIIEKYLKNNRGKS
jgi:predicted DNA-binding protein